MADDQYDNVINYVIGRKNRSLFDATQSLDDNPDDAAKAQKLSSVTGIDPGLVYNDLDNVERSTNATLITELIGNNPHLQEYLERMPLAAKISGHDWSKLDAVSQAMDKLDPPTLRSKLLGVADPSVLSAFFKSFAAGHGYEFGIPQEELDKVKPGTFVSMLLHHSMAHGLISYANESQRMISGAMTGVAGAAQQLYYNFTGDEQGALKFARDVMIMPQVAIPELAELAPAHAAKMINDIYKAGEAVRFHAEAGERPSPYTHPIIRELSKIETKSRMKDFDDLYKKAQATETNEISPEAFEEFARAKMGDANFSISAEKALELYPEGEVPTAEDGKLGWVPNIREQLAAAQHGRDVSVPWAGLGRITPEAMDVVHDGIRVAPMDLTIEDGKLAAPKVAKPEEAEPPTLADSIRQGAGVGQEDWGIKPLLPPEGIIPRGVKSDAVKWKGKEYPATAFKLSDALVKLPQDFSGVAEVLQRFFGNRISELAGDTPVKVLSDQDMRALQRERDLTEGSAGFYDPVDHQIVLHEWAALGYDPDLTAHTLLHEGAHAMTSRAILSYPTLAGHIRAVMDEADKFLRNVDPEARQRHNYAFTNEREFIAEAFSKKNFQEILAATPISRELADRLKIDQKSNNVWGAFRNILADIVEKLMGVRPTNSVMDAILHISPSFELAQEKGFKRFVRPDEAGEQIPENLRGAFKNGQALGMTQKMLEGFLKLVAKQQDEATKFERNKELFNAGLKNQIDWKTNWPRVNAEAKADILRRPDIAADRFLRTARLPNDKTGPVMALDPKLVDPEIVKKLDPRMFKEGGASPDRLAQIFNYQSGEQMMEALSRLADERATAGQTAAGHLRSLVDAETQRRMERLYGKSAEDLIKEAEDHVLSPTTMDILHAQYQAIYEANGQTPLTKDQIKAEAARVFDSLPLDTHSSKKYLAEMGREGEKIKAALVEGDGKAAMMAQQHQLMLAHQARLAVGLEKLTKQFYNFTNSHSGRELRGRTPEGVAWLHDIMFKIGEPPDRSPADLDLNKRLAAEEGGGAKTLKDYVERINKEREIYNQDPDNPTVINPIVVPKFLFEDGPLVITDARGTTRKINSIKDMTPAEFKQTFDAMKMIDKDALDAGKAVIKDKKESLRKVVGEFVQSLKEAVKDKPAGENYLAYAGRVFGSMVLNPETWFDRLDLGNRRGRWTQTFTRPIMEGAYLKEQYGREFAKLWREIGDFGPIHDVENPNLFMDPLTNFATPIKLDSHSVWAILANMGNALQREKLAKGYGIDDPGKIWDWLINVRKITKEDIQRAQRMGDVFDKAFQLSEKVYTELYGVTPERIELGEIETPWGPMKEWYHPLIADAKRKGPNVKAIDFLDESGYWKPSPAHGYTIKRKAGSYAVDLSFGTVPFKLNQILNDAAMRQPITEVSKLVFDSEFSNNFKRYMGKEYYDGLVKWLKDSAGNREWIPSNQQAIYNGLSWLQQNMNTGLIGWNLGTVLKHGPTALMFSVKDVGIKNYARTALQMMRELPGSREAWEFTKDNSNEMPTRIRWAQDSVAASNKELFQVYNHSWKERGMQIRDMIQLIGSAPVAFSDLVSSGPMWYAEYQRMMKESGMDHGTAVFLADTAVRRTHGSIVIPARSQIMRQNPFVSSLLPFYNFFNNALQRNYEMLWKSKLAIQGRELSAMTGYEKQVFEKGMKHVPEILGGLLVYAVGTSFWEQMIDPLPTEDLEEPLDYAIYGAKVLSRGPLTMVPGARDIVNGLWTGHDPSAGIYGTIFRNITNALKEDTWAGEDHEKIFRRSNALFWTLTGMSYDEIGKVGQFYVNVGSGREDAPEDASEYYKMIRHGTLKSHPKEVEDLPTRALRGFRE